MNMLDYTLEELHEKLVKKELTAEQLVESVFENIEKTEDTIGAFLTLTKEEPMVKDRKLDKEDINQKNLLSAIPIGIKDNIITEGTRTAAARKMLQNFVPVYNATVMDKVKESGMISVGKLNMDEFAMGGST